MRLIDADNMKKFVDVLYNCDGRADIIKRIIDQQPTAFDKDKVLSALYHYLDFSQGELEYFRAKFLEKIIDIIEGECVDA